MIRSIMFWFAARLSAIACRIYLHYGGGSETSEGDSSCERS